MSREIIVSKDFTFEASHILPKHEGKCSRLHGHSWGLTISVAGAVDTETGFVLDYAKLKKLVNEHVVEKLDHTHLGCRHMITTDPPQFQPNRNEDYAAQCYLGDSFYPSSENLVIAIAHILQPLIPELSANVRLYEVSLKETCTSAATYRLG